MGTLKFFERDEYKESSPFGSGNVSLTSGPFSFVTFRTLEIMISSNAQLTEIYQKLV